MNAKKDVNKIIKETAKQNHVAFWQIAEKLGISESTFTRRMRKELPADAMLDMLNIIVEIKAEREKEGV